MIVQSGVFDPTHALTPSLRLAALSATGSGWPAAARRFTPITNRP